MSPADLKPIPASALSTDAIGKRVLQIVLSARLVWPLTLLLSGLCGSLLAGLLILFDVGAQDTLARLQLLTAIISIVGFAAAVWQLLRQLLRPLVQLESSVGQVFQGEPGSSERLHLDDSGVLIGMMRDIEGLNTELSELYEDMEGRVHRQTRRLAQKTASLKILYDVAASINEADDLDDLLRRHLRVLKEMVNGLSASVRLCTSDDKLRLVAAIGLDNRLYREQEMLPLDLCPCGVPLSPADLVCANQARHCREMLHRTMFGPNEVDSIEVPLQHHGELLGKVDIVVRRPGITGREDIRELLTTIGSHLGMAVAKHRSDTEARRLTVVEERTALAHELHDSLAQTLVSLRFQVRMLDDSIRTQGDTIEARNDLLKIRNSVDEAHDELRELLASFRLRMDSRGLLPTLEDMLKQFGQETGVNTFFQRDCRDLNLNVSEEMQLLRVVQESLANIRKHAKAHTVRLLVACRSNGGVYFLVEDDGVGFDSSRTKGGTGEHIGLTIMEERLRRLGGELKIESEPGEGTRVEIVYQPKDRPKMANQRWVN